MAFFTLDQVKSIVAFLYAEARPGEEEPEPFGTCFFATNGEDDYIVTAKHVWQGLGSEGYVRVSKPGGGTSSIKLALDENEWLFHKDGSVDLALQRWTTSRWQDQAADLTSWPVGTVHATSTGRHLHEGQSACFVGLMRAFPGSGKTKNLVMLREGMIGLIPDEPIHGYYGNSDYIVLDAQSYKGNSGAPVFETEGHFELIGVLTHSFPDEAERYTVNGLPRTYYNLGVSLAAPISKLSEIMENDKRRTNFQ